MYLVYNLKLIYAKQNNGKFLLRIEDTDNQRNTKECIDAIFDSLKWLNISYDGEAVIQSKNIKRHVEVAKDLLQKDRAYQCFCTQEELDAHREYCTKNNIPPTYSKKCRNLTNEQRIDCLKNNQKPVIRLKVPEEEAYITINDKIKGKVSVQYEVKKGEQSIASIQLPIFKNNSTAQEILDEVTLSIEKEIETLDNRKELCVKNN
jgi:glutamyl/glutaminyl-tRNA synthetase